MKLAVMQPYLFPYLGYYQLVNAVDTFIFFDDVNYINKGWINRNNILINGKATMFTVPLRKSSQKKLIYEIELDDYEKWKIKFLRTIELAYKKAPFFNDRFNFLTVFFNRQYHFINELSSASIAEVAELLGLKPSFIFSKDLAIENKGHDGQSKIISICKNQNAKVYVNPINGKSLYNENEFLENNIQLKFIKMKALEYNQGQNVVFSPGLSMIDVLMFNSNDEIKRKLMECDID